MRNVEEVRFDSFVNQKTLSSREQEHNRTRQAAVGVLSLRRAPKLGKLLVCFASIRSLCDLRPLPNRKGLGPPAPLVFVDQFPRHLWRAR